MAFNPFDHVMDTHEWEFIETFHWNVKLPLIGDFQITKFMILQVVAAGLVMAIYIPIARRARSGQPPSGIFWNMFESILTFLRDQVARPNIGEGGHDHDHDHDHGHSHGDHGHSHGAAIAVERVADYDRFVPYLWTVFLYVLFCNLLGAIPFLASPTASLMVTGVLAFFAFLAIHLGAIAKLGVLGYLKSYVPNVEAPFGMAYFIVPLIVVIEVFGSLIKVGVLAVRLFANMLAGHTVLAVILGFIVMARNSFWPLFATVTFGSVVGVTALGLLEIFVAFLQAFIFTFLTAMFIGAARNPAH
jgi:F-type H+-transporting ATPase subunit a